MKTHHTHGIDSPELMMLLGSKHPRSAENLSDARLYALALQFQACEHEVACALTGPNISNPTFGRTTRGFRLRTAVLGHMKACFAIFGQRRAVNQRRVIKIDMSKFAQTMAAKKRMPRAA